MCTRGQHNLQWVQQIAMGFDVPPDDTLSKEENAQLQEKQDKEWKSYMSKHYSCNKCHISPSFGLCVRCKLRFCSQTCATAQ